MNPLFFCILKKAMRSLRQCLGPYAALFLALVLNPASALLAQSRSFGLGLRAAIDGLGITGKYYLDPGFSLEAQLNAGGIRFLEGRSISTTVMITYNLPLPLRVMRVYFGGGVHGGYWTGRTHSGHSEEFILGLDGVGGLEVFFRKMPLSISGELKPALNYIREVEFFPHNMIGMSFRYYFGRGQSGMPRVLF